MNVTRETFDRQMIRALAMRAMGMSSCAIGTMLGLRTDIVSHRFRRHDQREAVHLAIAPPKPKRPASKPVVASKTAAIIDSETVLWTRARRLAAARRLKLRWCIGHIADDLNGLPGPPLSARDVIKFARGEVSL